MVASKKLQLMVHWTHTQGVRFLGALDSYFWENEAKIYNASEPQWAAIEVLTS